MGKPAIYLSAQYEQEKQENKPKTSVYLDMREPRKFTPQEVNVLFRGIPQSATTVPRAAPIMASEAKPSLIPQSAAQRTKSAIDAAKQSATTVPKAAPIMATGAKPSLIPQSAAQQTKSAINAAKQSATTVPRAAPIMATSAKPSLIPQSAAQQTLNGVRPNIAYAKPKPTNGPVQRRAAAPEAPEPSFFKPTSTGPVQRQALELTPEQKNNMLIAQKIANEREAALEQQRQELKAMGYRDANLLDLTINSARQGFYNSQFGRENYKQMTGQSNNLPGAEATLSQDDFRFVPKKPWEQAVSGASALVGQQLFQMSSPESLAYAGTAAAAAALAGNAGPQIAIPEEIITVPGATLVGLQMGGTQINYELEAGLAYREMADNGIDPKTAQKIATAVGAGNALLEAVQLNDLKKSFTALSATDGTQNLSRKILNEIVRRTGNVATETAQEIAQEGVAIGGSQLASQLQRGTWQYGAEEVGQRLGDTAASAALAFFGLNAAGAAGRTVRNHFNAPVPSLGSTRAQTTTPVPATPAQPATAPHMPVPSFGWDNVQTTPTQPPTQPAPAPHMPVPSFGWDNVQTTPTQPPTQPATAPQMPVPSLTAPAQSAQNTSVQGLKKDYSVISKMVESAPKLSLMEPVKTMTGNEFQKSSGKLTEQVGSYFESIGGKVERPGFGEVILDRRGIKDDIAHGVGRAKSITFAAVPEIIQKGAQIDYAPNWKGRGYDSYMFAAPVDIAGRRANVAVVVNRAQNSNNFYLHEVVDSEGNRIYIKDEEPTTFKTGSSKNEFATGVASSSFDTIIPQQNENVNRSDFQASNLGEAKAFGTNTVGAAEHNPNSYYGLITEHGTIAPGENPARTVDVPRKNAQNEPVSLAARTIMEAGVTTDAEVEMMERMIENGELAHEVISDKSAMNQAVRTIQRYGWENAVGQWDGAVNERRFSKESIALGQTIYNQAVQNRDIPLIKKMIVDLTFAASESGRNLQATRMLKKLTPDGKLYGLEQSVNKINEDLRRRYKEKFEESPQQDTTAEQAGETYTEDNALPNAETGQTGEASAEQNQAARKTPRKPSAKKEAAPANENETRLKAYQKTIKEIVIPNELAEELLNSTGGADTDAAVAKIEQYIADRIPTTWQDKWNAWRYLAMLGNTRTHIRNVVGNAAFIPAVKLKNRIAQTIEVGVNAVRPRFGLEPLERTKTVTFDKSIRDFAKNDYPEMESTLRGGGKYSPSNSINDKRTIFKNRLLEGARKLNTTALEAEDAAFLKLHYVDSLSSYMAANNLTADYLNSNTPEANAARNRARTHAISEAQKATYRDANAVASFLNNSKRKLNEMNGGGKAASVALEGLVPFTKTPSNILRRGFEYSPAGLLKSLAFDLAKVKRGDMTATQAIDGIAAGLTGTAVIALGMWLHSMGLISGGGDEDKRQSEFDRLNGEQNYALKIGNWSYTLDWLAPMSLPLFIGAEIDKMRGEEGASNVADYLDAFSMIAEPMVEMSMLQGINNTIKAAAFGDNALTSIGTELATSYFSQGVPTLLGHVARAVDPIRRNTSFVNPESPLPQFLQKPINRAAAKIPFASKLLPPMLDQWGREQENAGGSFGGRLAANMLSPGYYSKSKAGDLEAELQRLYDETGETGVLPSYPAKSIQFDSETIKFNTNQYIRFSTTKGQLSREIAQGIVTNNAYGLLSDEQKAQAIQKAYDYATAVAKSEVSEYKLSKSEAEIKMLAESGISPDAYIIAYIAQKNIAGDKNTEGNTIPLSAAENKWDAINSATRGLSNREKQELYKAFGISEKVW